ncbi:AraC family transcriptional regulator [Rhodopseudomonas sp. BR0M22]|uniref:AraC family transcriptional regulator n=1 Tax=Rhodopseudomonas sp. BR0M22 TaxID=2269369 RepID=UPI0013DF47C8|nr:AraC family transcriptional regulator [Rhodopseudomonas sp. BR0M22]NEW91043.1 AraC family transcriptional regulator [Rhodopseudomonas sp. BR0M22]
MSQRNHYSTASLSAADSIAAWRQAMAEVYYRLDIQARQDDRVVGELIDVQFAAMGVSNFRADAQRVIRRKESAKIDQSEDFVFLFPTRKALQFEQRGRSGLAMPGAVFLLNSAEDYVVDVPDGSENITIKIDRELLIDRVKGIDGLCATMNIGNSKLVPVVATLGTQLLSLPPGEHADRLQQSVIDLICLMLDLREEPQDGAFIRQRLASSLFSRIDHYLQHNLKDHELTPDQAAREHKISVRYLHKIFHYHGTSFGQRLLELRLQRARQLIVRHGGANHVNLGQVAYECGFTSQSYFSTCYRRRFGLTPRQSGQLVTTGENVAQAERIDIRPLDDDAE